MKDNLQNDYISNYNELRIRLEEVRLKKRIQRDELNISLNEFTEQLSLSSIVLALSDNEGKGKAAHEGFNVANAGLNVGANFIIDAVLGKNRSIKGFVTSVIAENISKILIKKNSTKIVSGFKNLLGKVLRPT
ncbi:hypothetical protein BH11BAC2_BH11BAC2_14260 [soil metagenome]